MVIGIYQIREVREVRLQLTHRCVQRKKLAVVGLNQSEQRGVLSNAVGGLRSEVSLQLRNGSGVRADATRIRADLTCIRGNRSSVCADATRIRADLTCIRGNRSSICADATRIRADRTCIRGNGSSVRADASCVGADTGPVRGNVASIGGNQPSKCGVVRGQSSVSRSAVRYLLCEHNRQTVGRSFRSTGCEHGNRDSRNSHHTKGGETATTVHLHLEGVTTGRPIDCSQISRTSNTADCEVDQTEFIGEHTGVRLCPHRRRCGIKESKADVQGGIFQGVSTRIAGNGLVCNPIVLLGLETK